MTDVAKMRTTRFVKSALDIFTGLTFLVSVLLPLITVGMVNSHAGAAEDWSAHINLVLRYNLDLTQIPGLDLPKSSIHTPAFQGSGDMSFITHSLTAVYAWGVRMEIMALLGLYSLWQLRVVFVHIRDGEVFSVSNAGRLVKIGYISVAASLVTPWVDYFGSSAALPDIAFQVPGFHLAPISPFAAIGMGFAGLFSGLMIIVLARVMRAAARMREDQELTV